MFLIKNIMPTFKDIKASNAQSANEPVKINAKGSQCPGPIMSLAEGIKKAKIDQKVIIEATDPGFIKDAISWAAVTTNTLDSIDEKDGIITAIFTKKMNMGEASLPPKEDMATIIMFSDEMDKGLAAFNITLGALAMGMKVQIFFTFWGLSLIRQKRDHADPRSFKEKVLGHVLPADDMSLSLSHKNLMGLGAKMMSNVMKEKNVPPLDFMIHLAKYDGVKFIACQMSMEILGIKKEDLMDGVEVGGVAMMLEYARKSNLNYFI